MNLMVEVVFSDSEKGSMRAGHMKAAQYLEKGAGGAIDVSVRHPNGTQPTREEYDAALAEAKRRQEQEWQDGKPLGGDPGDVIGLPFALDLGDIASPVTGSSRKGLLARILAADPWDELQDMEDSLNRFWEGCISDMDKLTARAKAGEPVRVWYSSAPYAMRGLYDAVSLLKDCGCRVSAVRLPLWAPFGEDGAKSSVSWGEVAPGEFAQYLPLENEIPGAVQRAITMEWEQLKRKNTPLRVVLNGKLHGADLDFYDCFIRKEVPDGTFQVGQLIGFVLGRNSLGVGDWLIAQRVRKMIESGELTVVQKNSAFYATILKKAL